LLQKLESVDLTRLLLLADKSKNPDLVDFIVDDKLTRLELSREKFLSAVNSLFMHDEEGFEKRKNSLMIIGCQVLLREPF
jgi:hypothetical protein